MMVSTWEQMTDIAEALGWSVDSRESKFGKDFEFQQYTPAGEDFSFTACGKTPEEVAADVMEYARDFDRDEHVRSVMDMRGAPDLETLVGDAHEIETMVQELANALYYDWDQDAEEG